MNHIAIIGLIVAVLVTVFLLPVLLASSTLRSSWPLAKGTRTSLWQTA